MAQANCQEKENRQDNSKTSKNPPHSRRRGKYGFLPPRHLSNGLVIPPTAWFLNFFYIKKWHS